MKLKFKILIGLAILFIVAIVIIFFVYFGNVNHVYTQLMCMSCHEINQPAMLWSHSAHKDLNCIECHGTALSNGLHSLNENISAGLHILKKNRIEDAGLTEVQMREMMNRCKSCHQKEYKSWESGNHSVKYTYIFLNKIHNTTERLNSDCLRCHGMFYSGTIQDLVTPIDKKGPWALKDTSMSNKPVILCMTCHQMHPKELASSAGDYSDSASVKRKLFDFNKLVGFYSRPENHFFPADKLPTPKIYKDTLSLTVSEDNRQKVCLQCHSPNSRHKSGTGDDRTPSGVHMGISCLSCHDPHSTKPVVSCVLCHKTIMDCKIPVETMNTSFKNKFSKHDIHFVKCTDCHNGNEAKIITALFKP